MLLLQCYYSYTTLVLLLTALFLINNTFAPFRDRYFDYMSVIFLALFTFGVTLLFSQIYFLIQILNTFRFGKHIHPSSSESQEHSVTIPTALFDFEDCDEAEKATQQRPAHLQFRTCRGNITE